MNGCTRLTELAEADFSRQVLQSEHPVLVAFCPGTSAADLKFLELLAKWVPRAQGTVRMFRARPADSASLARQLSLPSSRGLALFSRGTICYQYVGEGSRSDFDEVLDRAVSLTARSTKGGPPAGDHAPGADRS
jgi:thioredoxin-like negative regulator of GroEL